jgi:hypothetical protein
MTERNIHPQIAAVWRIESAKIIAVTARMVALRAADVGRPKIGNR